MFYNAHDRQQRFHHQFDEAPQGPPVLNLRTRALIRLAVLISTQEVAGFANGVQEAVTAGVSREEIEETILHLSIYVGFPRALQSFNRMKGLGLKYSNKKIEDEAVGHFNFFTLPEIKQALQDVHPDFAWIAGTNAAALCARGGLSPLERALITLASDVVQEVFEGPFQIHIRMVQECGGSMFMIEDALGFLSSIVPLEKTLQAIEILNTTRPALGPSL